MFMLSVTTVRIGVCILKQDQGEVQLSRQRNALIFVGSL